MARIVLAGGALLYVLIFALETSALILLPHDVRPGHAIRHFVSNHSRYTLLEPEYASYFTLLDDGLLMTTADLAPLLNQPLNLAVLEQTPFSSSAHSVHLLVMDRRKMLHFTESSGLNGEIPENSPPGTVVEIPPIKATAVANVGPIAYKIIRGNEELIFALRDKAMNTDSEIRSVITDGDVEIIAKKSLDAESKKFYDLIIQATDLHGINKANLPIRINVANENDHEPIFEQEIYYFAVNGTCESSCHNGSAHWQRFSNIGKVNAFDIDGDRVYYSVKTPTNLAVIVPQTGELILAGEPDGHEVELQVLAHDTGTPPRKSQPAQVFIEFIVREQKELPTLHREKRRVTRAVRPTKRIEFTEADGEVEGRAVFTLEKETDRETFKIRDENPWVTVEPSGVVKVKKKWDYEELGPEKTIDFWVTITNAGNGVALKYTDNQRVIIHVKDVNDEPPYFINRPLPMQTVVQLNAAPNTPVFTLQARDPDTDHNIHYFIVRDRTGGRFEVDERSGVVRTRGTDPFQLDMEYVLYVKAEDQSGRVDERRFQSTPEERLSIVGGKRAPQFYLPSYEAEIAENQKKDSDIISVKAKSFADREIRYTLKAQGQGAGTFNIGPTSGIVKLAKELDFEDLRQPHVYSLVVTATEDSGGFSTSVELTIRVTDVNDNAPKFELPDYQAHNVDEDIPLGTSILKVKAMDADSGKNAEIEYLVSDDHFSVDSNGIITNNKQLDADNNNAYYEFVVTAKDKGEPAKTGTATVRVYTKNKNDEEPKFSQQVYTPNVDENAGPNTLVTTVVASDKDGDNVRFGFVGGGTSSGQFVIEEITGVIRLHNKAISLDRDKYELNVTALDDGACCVNGDATIHTSTAVVVVFITDVNDNKPIFKDCPTYFPKVEEGAPNGSPVIKVHATDEDKGVNGQVKYSIVQQPNQKGTKFTVDEETGEVSTNKVFDREGDDGKFVSVTVKATDQGEPSLEGVCSFTVEITDVNDNPPLFDRQKYVENVKQDASIGTNILRVSASDEDADNNGAIVYTLSAPYNPADIEYFEIQPESGWIVLKKPLDVSIKIDTQ
ncbi:neural-cadherin-like [Vanessa cardui]|uniref:neural-cadherin-like n=1 Tax=Vanessa cardui TaxID=171605 RepID=UPI001F12CC6E|nr:neural-cadherin-like [Vanessa cardui]